MTQGRRLHSQGVGADKMSHLCSGTIIFPRIVHSAVRTCELFRIAGIFPNRWRPSVELIAFLTDPNRNTNRRSSQSQSLHKLNKARIRAQTLEKGVFFNVPKSAVMLHVGLLKRSERLVILSQSGVKDGEPIPRNVG